MAGSNARRRVEAQRPAHARIPKPRKVVLRHPGPLDRADETVVPLDRNLVAVPREHQDRRLVGDGRRRGALRQRDLRGTIHHVLIQRRHCGVVGRVRDGRAEQGPTECSGAFHLKAPSHGPFSCRRQGLGLRVHAASSRVRSILNRTIRRVRTRQRTRVLFPDAHEVKPALAWAASGRHFDDQDAGLFDIGVPVLDQASQAVGFGSARSSVSPGSLERS